jgi:hypothetical protein
MSNAPNVTDSVTLAKSTQDARNEHAAHGALDLAALALQDRASRASELDGTVAEKDYVTALAPPPPYSAATHSISFFGSEKLCEANHIPASIFDPLVVFAKAKLPARRDYKYWGGANQPWRHGTSDKPVEKQAVIAVESEFKAAAEAEDRDRYPTADSHADMLALCALRADFLLALTSALGLWEWKTVEVVQFLVKPATETHGRCRFAHLPFVRPFTGAASVFVSHCWSGRWGDLVGAVCAGGRMDRMVWIDIAAVRQWPGNVADIDFRAVVQRCMAFIHCGSGTCAGEGLHRQFDRDGPKQARCVPRKHRICRHDQRPCVLPALVHRRDLRCSASRHPHCFPLLRCEP